MLYLHIQVMKQAKQILLRRAGDGVILSILNCHDLPFIGLGLNYPPLLAGPQKHRSGSFWRNIETCMMMIKVQYSFICRVSVDRRIELKICQRFSAQK